MPEPTERPIGGTDVYSWYYVISEDEYNTIKDYDNGALVNHFVRFAGLAGYYAPQTALKTPDGTGLSSDYDVISEQFPLVDFEEAWFTRSTEPNALP